MNAAAPAPISESLADTQNRDIATGNETAADMRGDDDEQRDADRRAEVASGVVGAAAHGRAVRLDAGVRLAAEDSVEQARRNSCDQQRWHLAAMGWTRGSSRNRALWPPATITRHDCDRHGSFQRMSEVAREIRRHHAGARPRDDEQTRRPQSSSECDLGQRRDERHRSDDASLESQRADGRGPETIVPKQLRLDERVANPRFDERKRKQCQQSRRTENHGHDVNATAAEGQRAHHAGSSP